MTETRYWQRVGFRVSLEQAEEIIEKMGEGVSGKIMDEDTEEYTNVVSVDIHSAHQEVTTLFDNSDTTETVDEDNSKILALMDFERGRKQFILDCKASGMELPDAKLAYEAAKATMVRESLGLPEIVEINEEE
mgnify:CR=1 FL=1|jgi:hypothetical protein